MNAAAVINCGYAVVISAFGFFLIRLSLKPRHQRRQAARTAEASARRGLTVWDTTAEKWIRLPHGTPAGPGQMTGHDIAEADELELLWLAPAYDPELDAGFDRLRKAIRDEQNEGDQA